MFNKNKIGFVVKCSHSEARLLAELAALRVREVVVGEGGVERGDEVEEALPGDGVAQEGLSILVTAAAAAAAVRPRARVLGGEAVAAVAVLRRAEGLQGVRAAPALAAELLVGRLLAADHLAGVALDPENYKQTCENLKALFPSS